ncbi:MAG: AgmX/PglI C-terminal domain-containing protein, partial [Byssovorax sp.]
MSTSPRTSDDPVDRGAASAVPPLALDAPCAPRARGALFHIGLSAAAHFAVLGLSLQASMASIPEDDELSQIETVRELLVSAEHDDRARDQAVPLSDGDGDVQGVAKSARAGDGRAGGGQKALGAEGKMGDRDASSARHGHYAVPERVKKDPSPSLAREEALSDAATFGMIGLLGQGPAVPVAAAWSADLEAHGSDALAARGEMWARETGQYQGLYGLGLSGIGEGGGGRGEGIGLGTVGRLGHLDGPPGSGTSGDGVHGGGSLSSWTSGTGRLGGLHRTRPPRFWWDDVSVSGRLPPESIQRIIRQNFGRFRLCYEKALSANPTLEGRVTARFVIGRDGAVSSVSDGGSDIANPAVVSCVVRAFYGLSFPQP